MFFGNKKGGKYPFLFFVAYLLYVNNTLYKVKIYYIYNGK